MSCYSPLRVSARAALCSAQFSGERLIGLSSEALAKEDPSLKISDVMSNLFNKLVTTYPFITVIHR